MGRVGQIATVLLIVLLAGGPTVASVCEGMCVPPVATTEATATVVAHSRGHHHQAADQTPTDVQQTGVPHNHNQTGTDAASPRDSQVNRMLGRDCCTEFAPPRPSLTASRADTDLLPEAQAALVVSAAMLQIRDRQPAGPTHGPPPGGLVSARTPIVLRI